MSGRADRFTAVLDANVLAGALPRNILLSLAEAEFFRPRWSAEILDEFVRQFERRFGDLEGAARQRRMMERAFPEALVTDHQGLIEVLELPDPDDRHVLAAALQTKAAVIVTENLRDFPVAVLARYDIEPVGLDDFIADILDLAGSDAVAALRLMRERFRQPSITAGMLIRKIEQLGLTQTADMLTGYEDLL